MVNKKPTLREIWEFLIVICFGAGILLLRYYLEGGTWFKG